MLRGFQEANFLRQPRASDRRTPARLFGVLVFAPPPPGWQPLWPFATHYDSA
jgi:hypothetical protein